MESTKEKGLNVALSKRNSAGLRKVLFQKHLNATVAKPVPSVESPADLRGCLIQSSERARELGIREREDHLTHPLILKDANKSGL